MAGAEGSSLDDFFSEKAAGMPHQLCLSKISAMLRCSLANPTLAEYANWKVDPVVSAGTVKPLKISSKTDKGDISALCLLTARPVETKAVVDILPEKTAGSNL